MRPTTRRYRQWEERAPEDGAASAVLLAGVIAVSVLAILAPEAMMRGVLYVFM